MSRFIISFLLFVAVNFLAAKSLLHFGEMSNPQLQHLQEQTWTQWAIADFEKQRQQLPSIVILGSSLVLTPLNLADANFSNSTINGALHHKSNMLSSLLSAKNNGETNFSFALPGLMPSDAYLITKLLLCKSDMPKIIVYGVGPRDFVDNLLASPASTDPYRCLARSLDQGGDYQTAASFVGNSWQSKLDYFFSHHLSLYGNKDTMLSELSRQWRQKTSSTLAEIFPDMSFGKLTVADVHNLLPNYDPMSIDINQCLFVPNPKIDPERFTKDLNEYRMRYGKVNWDTFTCQSKFFLDFLKIARTNNIKVLVLAMPITSVNRQLLPEYIFTTYKDNLRVLTKTYGADFIDLDSSGLFNDNDFGDTVHLSTTGSVKFLHSIAEGIEQAQLLQANGEYRKRLAEAGVKL